MVFDLNGIKRATNKERIIWGFLLSICDKNQSEMQKLLRLKNQKQITRVQNTLVKGKLISIVEGEDSMGRSGTSIWKTKLELVIRTLIINLKLRKNEVTFLRSFLDVSIPLLALSIEKASIEDKQELKKEQLAPLKSLIAQTIRNNYLLPFLHVFLSFEREVISYGVDYTIGKDFDTKEAIQEWANLMQKNDKQIRIFKALFKEWFNSRPKGEDWRRVVRDRTLLSFVYEDLMRDLSNYPAPGLLSKFLGFEDGRFGVILLTKQLGRPEIRKKLRERPKDVSADDLNELQMMFLFYLFTEFPEELCEEIHIQWGKETIRRLAEIIKNHLNDPRFRPTKWQKERINMLFSLEGAKRDKMKKQN